MYEMFMCRIWAMLLIQKQKVSGLTHVHVPMKMLLSFLSVQCYVDQTCVSCKTTDILYMNMRMQILGAILYLLS